MSQVPHQPVNVSPVEVTNVARVQLQRQVPPLSGNVFLPFYTAVRAASDALGFQNYSNFICHIFCGCDSNGVEHRPVGPIKANSALERARNRDLAFSGVNAYDQLREATELFVGSQAALLQECAAGRAADGETLPEVKSRDAALRVREAMENPYGFTMYDVDEINLRCSPEQITFSQLLCLTKHLFVSPDVLSSCCDDEDQPDVPAPKSRAKNRAGDAAPGATNGAESRQQTMAKDSLEQVLYFMHQLLHNQTDPCAKDLTLGTGRCTGVLRAKLRSPPMVELIWSYWMEQGMLVQGINAISMRYQNRLPVGRDPLVRCDVSPLRSLNNVLWGYLQRESDRLSVVRRGYEYDHHYGLRLDGRALPQQLSSADSRSHFLEAFHRLLQEAARYYRVAMDSTMHADDFPVLNCLRELHLILAEGAHNQFGDLPTTARSEMLFQQWILSRPEIRDFLGGRPGVPYPEDWMPHMETLRTLMGWNDTSIRHYRDLATYGERLLLSVRYLPWSSVNLSTLAGGWLQFWRPEIQGYLHSYRAVTGVDLGIDDVRVQQPSYMLAQPSDLIRRRRAAQLQASGNGSL